MADISITTSEVRPAVGAPAKRAIAGEAISPGEVIYLASGKAWRADADDTAAKAAAVGVAVSAADGVDQPIEYQDGGLVTLGAAAALTVGEIYVVSGTPGALAPEGDLASGDYVTVVGVAVSASELKVGIIAGGVQVA